MTTPNLEAGRGALAKAMELARSSSRAAKVAALLVPLATISANYAHAGQASMWTGSKGFTFNTPANSGGSGGTVTGTVAWDVTEVSCAGIANTIVSDCGDYNYNISVNMTSGDLTDVLVPIIHSNDVFNVSITSGSFDYVIDPNLNVFVQSGASPQTFLDFSYDSQYAPMFENYTVAGFFDCGGDCNDQNGTAVDPPAPNSVPEPGTLALFGMALAGFAAWRRRLTG
jgi:hypothetical protein